MIDEHGASDFEEQARIYGSVHGLVQCDRCLLVFSFLVTADEPEGVPLCPDCARPLEDYSYVCPEKSGTFPKFDAIVYEKGGER
jgi:hypothetical protein